MTVGWSLAGDKPLEVSPGDLLVNQARVTVGLSLAGDKPLEVSPGDPLFESSSAGYWRGQQSCLSLRVTHLIFRVDVCFVVNVWR